jgi:hypothetical protein
MEAVRREPSGNDRKFQHPSPDGSGPMPPTFGLNLKRYGASCPVTTGNFSIHHRTARTVPLKAGGLGQRLLCGSGPFQFFGIGKIRTHDVSRGSVSLQLKILLIRGLIRRRMLVILLRFSGLYVSHFTGDHWLMGTKKTGKGRRKIGRKKRRMRSRIRHRKG